MRLASHLHRTEAEAKRTVSLEEFYRWKAFDELEGFGRKSENIQAAVIAASICRSFGGGKVKADDFLREDPEWWSDGRGDELGWFSRERNRKP
jgi:hypothetical protein